MIDLKGKVAMVTGGGRGIGRAITLALAEAGAKVAITYNQDEESAKKTLMYHDNVIAIIQLDVTSPSGDDMKRLANDLGGLDILVNNAGVNRPASFDRIVFNDWQTVIETNLTGVFYVTHTLLPLINDGGSVIFIGSVSSDLGGPQSVHYAVSKGGLEAMCRGVARFVAPRGIRANVISPGYITSPMTDKGMQSEVVKMMVDQIPLGRLGTKEEIASVVAFLASPLSSYITGTVIRVNGGLYMA